ncbi:VP5 [Gokushovirus WZ-2015a]|nr:VP5 [Gokushovirus WZ-2015a]
MSVNVYGIFDNCVMGYITIFTEKENKVAERNFKIALTDEHNMMSKTPSDYRLVRLAKFDEKTGEFENEKENIFDGVSLSK